MIYIKIIFFFLESINNELEFWKNIVSTSLNIFYWAKILVSKAIFI